MKILVVSDLLYGENYGITIKCMNLIKHLYKNEDDVRLLCPDANRVGMLNYYIIKKIKFDNVTDAVSEINNAILDRQTTKVIKGIIKEMDVIHIMSPFYLGNLVARVAYKMGIPVTAGFHSQAENITASLQMMNVELANKVTYQRFYDGLYKYANAIHYPTEFVKMLFENSIGRRTNGHIISSGVNECYKKMDVVRKPEFKDKFVILFIGRYSIEKNHEVLLKAVAKSRYKDKIQLVFAGQGSFKQDIVELASSLDINKPIMKFVSREELVEIINSSDLYVHPSEVEVEAISCLEAINCGLVPLISNSPKSVTRIFALTEFNSFQNNDIDDLRRKIDYWIDNPKEKEKCSKLYLDFTKSYSQEECLDKLREMLLTYADPINHNKIKKYYYADEINDDFAFNKINVKDEDKPFKYVHTNPFWRATSTFLYYVVGRPLVFLLLKIAKHNHIKNKHVLKRYKKEGYFIYANHTNGMADAFTPNLLSRKRNYIIVSRETVSIHGIKNLVTMFGAIPVYSKLEELDSFNACIKKRISQNRSITIYPEAHIWPYYTKIRPFKKDSFRYPVDLNRPVYVITNTWQKRRFTKGVKLISYLSGPFFPNQELNRSEAMQDLRDQVYQEMVKVSSSVNQREKVKYIRVKK